MVNIAISALSMDDAAVNTLFLFLQVSADGEVRLYEACTTAGITLLSIAHRPALKRFHSVVVHVEGDAGGSCGTGRGWWAEEVGGGGRAHADAEHDVQGTRHDGEFSGGGGGGGVEDKEAVSGKVGTAAAAVAVAPAAVAVTDGPSLQAAEAK